MGAGVYVDPHTTGEFRSLAIATVALLVALPCGYTSRPARSLDSGPQSCDPAWPPVSLWLRGRYPDWIVHL